jgi:hypothetical protein
MAPMLYHGLSRLGLPVVCVESRQAYQALKSLATHKTDRNDARGLAHLARTGFFKPVHVKSLPAHAVEPGLPLFCDIAADGLTIPGSTRSPPRVRTGKLFRLRNAQKRFACVDKRARRVEREI